MQSPLVSIIVPCYKVASFIEDCIRSILEQSISNIECIAIDDGSPDDTFTRLTRLASKDTRLHVIHLLQNEGVSNARNQGLLHAKGQWLMFVDGDDFLPKNAVENLLRQAKFYPEAALICANAILYSEDGKSFLRPHFKAHGTFTFNVFSESNCFEKYQEHFNNCCFKLFRRDLIGSLQFSKDLRYGEDTLFCHQYAIANKITVSMDYDTSVYCYRQINSSCIHTATLQCRLHDLENIITALNALGRNTAFPTPLAKRKATEYLWVIKKFAQNKTEQIGTLKQLMSSDFYHSELQNILHSSPKLRHKLVLFLLEHKIFSAIRWW